MQLQRFLTLKIRRRRRYQAGNDLYVLLDNMPIRHRIYDISTGGLSYHYISRGYRPRSGTFPLKIAAKDDSISLDLEGRTIVDREAGADVSGNQTIYRRSIRFEKMNGQKKKAIKKIIKNFTVKSSMF